MGIKFMDFIKGNNYQLAFPVTHKIRGKEYKPIGVKGMFENVKA